MYRNENVRFIGGPLDGKARFYREVTSHMVYVDHKIPEEELYLDVSAISPEVPYARKEYIYYHMMYKTDAFRTYHLYVIDGMSHVEVDEYLLEQGIIK